MSEKAYSGSWTEQPDAAAYLEGLFQNCLQRSPALNQLAGRVLTETSSRLYDYVDAFVLPQTDAVTGRLEELGFAEEEDVRSPGGETSLHHPGAIFPRVLVRPGATGDAPLGIRFQVENLPRCLAALGRTAEIEGAPLAAYRHCTISAPGDLDWVIGERRGALDCVAPAAEPEHAHRYLRGVERWLLRERRFDRLEDGLAATLKTAQDLVAEFGRDEAAWIAFEAERIYWEQRNLTARVQKRRLDALGLGWANHDHHTFRSSREAFPQLIAILEAFGFQCREQFYAGTEAGWGAQVLEHPVCRIAIFADVDLAPEEVEGDFAHKPLPPREELGTVGLWCALHGESILEAGLHHLAGRFEFDRFREDITREGHRMLDAFANTELLRQAFSEGERWTVPAARLERLVAQKVIDQAQAERFGSQGVIGSHIENIQRGLGFKGFSQKSVSDIIRRTDPRAEGATAGPGR